MPDTLTVFQGARFDVDRLQVDAGGGRLATREVVRPRNAVVILPVLDPARLVLIRNRRFAVDDELWELPAGTLEPGEDPAACAARELEEETGYRPARVARLTEFFPSPGFCTELLTAFRADGLSRTEQNLDDTERITPEVVTIDDALGMIQDGRIRDAKTIAALLYEHTFGDLGRPPG